MASGSGNDDNRPAFKSPQGEIPTSTSGRSHHSPSSSPSLSGLRFGLSEHPPHLDLRLSDPPARYVSSVTGHSSLPQYYVAVERPQFKLGTLKDLLGVLANRGEVAVGICCGTRDVLDGLVGAIAYETHFSIQCLHSDQTESDRAKILSTFQARKQSSLDPLRDPPPPVTPPESSTSGSGESLQSTENGSGVKLSKRDLNILAVTDACLPTAALGESPLLARLMINYELPAKKEQYTRRVAAVLGPSAASALPKISPGGSSPPRPFQSGTSPSSSGIALSFVAAAEVGVLRSLEESLGYIIEEMPINILELL